MTTAEAIRQPRGAFAALTSRSYRIYLGGQSLANMGTWMQSIAQDWLVYDLTHSSTSVGVTMALQFLPILVLGLHTGGLADRLPKRRILLTTQTLNAAATTALAVITVAGAVHATDVCAFALLSGLIFAFNTPARQAFVAEVVPPAQLRAAIALNGAVFQASAAHRPGHRGFAHRQRGHRVGVRGQRRLLRGPGHRPAPGYGRPISLRPRPPAASRERCGRPPGTWPGVRTCCGPSSWSGCSERSA